MQINVIDNGPGIPPEQADHIFERFVRGDAGLTQRVGGTGLGLAISRSLVDLHGGTIAVDSEVGRGSTFTVRLPLAPAGAVEASPAGAARSPRARDDPVLVADDSETILLLMRRRLELAGYEVETAADGQEVTERIDVDAADGPDLLLLDAMMPRKSGIDALRELRAAGLETPALIVSAHQDANDADAPTDLEISGFVTKPIDFDRLLGAVAELTAD